MKKMITLSIIGLLLVTGCSKRPQEVYSCNVGGEPSVFIFKKDGTMSLDGNRGTWQHEEGDYYSIYTINGAFVGYLKADKVGITPVSFVGQERDVLPCRASKLNR